MRIANPIYDAVFKFMMEDNEIARELLSLILGEEIETLELRPQETASFAKEIGVAILRFDFKALVKTATGERKKILIELQKAKHMLDIMRFRRYLGDNYRKTDEFSENDETKTEALDIVTVYFLGFNLPNVPYAVLKSNNCYQDVLTGKMLEEKVKEPFVNLLDHEAFFIQIRRLKPKLQTRLENTLLVFSQENKTDDVHELDFNGNLNDPLVSRMVKRLQFAIADEEVQRQMEIEDEIFNQLLEIQRKHERSIAEKDAVITEKDAVITEKNAVITEKDVAISEKDETIQALRQKLLDLGINPDAVS